MAATFLKDVYTPVCLSMNVDVREQIAGVN